MNLPSHSIMHYLLVSSDAVSSSNGGGAVDNYARYAVLVGACVLFEVDRGPATADDAVDSSPEMVVEQPEEDWVAGRVGVSQ